MVNRNFVQIWLLFLLLCTLYPAACWGQTRVGVIFSGNIAYYRAMHKAFLDGISENYPEAEKIKYILQFPAPDPVALSNSAKKLVIGGVDLIVSYGYPATQAVWTRDSDIPHIYVGVYDPEKLIGTSQKMTGSGYTIPMATLFDTYMQIVNMKRLVVLFSLREKDSSEQLEKLAGLAEKEQIDFVSIDIASRRDLDKLNQLGKGDAVIITGSSQVHAIAKDILAALKQRGVPAADVIGDLSKLGAIISYYQEPEQLGLSASEIAAEFLKGEKVENYKPIVSSQMQLVLNSGEAAILGITIPTDIEQKATIVIQE